MTVIPAMWLINCFFSLLRGFFLFAWTTAASVMEEVEWPVYCADVCTDVSVICTYVYIMPHLFVRVSTQVSLLFFHMSAEVSQLSTDVYMLHALA
jgi:hypothetical protein